MVLSDRGFSQTDTDPANAGHISSEPQTNFTVCLPPLFNFSDHMRLVEAIEVNRLFGAQRFVFYNYSTGSDVVKYMRSYAEDGIAMVIPWPLPSRRDENR